METTNGIFIIDSLGKCLVVHPTNHSMHLYSIPKGLTDEDESSLEAGVREVKEETNLDLYDLMGNGSVNYYDLGEYVYPSKKKIIHAHLMIFGKGEPLSEMDLDLKCDSYYNCKNDGKEYPEVDIIKWEDMEFLKYNLHHTQQTFLEKVEELVAKHIKK